MLKSLSLKNDARLHHDTPLYPLEISESNHSEQIT